MIKNVLITGGNGFVGSEIMKLLILNGYHVAILSRRKKNTSIKHYLWNIDQGWIDPEAIKFADAIIHLAGENISSKRWTKKQKRKILESRTHSTELLYGAVKTSSSKPRLIISASAVGYYGTYTSEKIFSENLHQGTDFLAKTVGEWEKSVSAFKDLNMRIVIFRKGVVMSPKGGALKKMLLPLKFGFATPVGKGKQYVPWVSLNDLIRLFLFTIENEEIEGVYNVVSPVHITNKELMLQIADIKNKLFIPFGVPALILKLIYGKMSSVILQGSRVSSEKITKTGFNFSDGIIDVF